MLTDPIFTLEEPASATYPNETNCHVCDKIFKVPKKEKSSKKKKVENQITLCQFCGHRTCERCCTKMRAFANQTE